MKPPIHIAEMVYSAITHRTRWFARQHRPIPHYDSNAMILKASEATRDLIDGGCIRDMSAFVDRLVDVFKAYETPTENPT